MQATETMTRPATGAAGWAKPSTGAGNPAIAGMLLKKMRDACNGDGHTAVPRAVLVERAARAANASAADTERTLAACLADGRLAADSVEGRDCVFIPRLHEIERKIARKLVRIARAKTSFHPVSCVELVNWVAPRMPYPPNVGQITAMNTVYSSKLTVLTGPPGVGKTFVIDGIVKIARRLNLKVALCALAGRAAKNMEEATKETAETIHMLLGADDGGFRHDAGNMIRPDVLVVDEGAMVNATLFWDLMQAIPDTTTVVLVGDVDQLEPIGAGNPFHDLIRSGLCPVIRLTEITRQAAGSNIIRSTHRINAGLMPIEDPDAKGQDFFFEEAAGSAAVTARVVDLVRNRIPQGWGLDPIRDTQVLSPMKANETGTVALNAALQAALNGSRSNQTITSNGVTFREGDKILQTRNNYDLRIRNGDFGVLESIDSGRERIVARFGDTVVRTKASALDDIIHGHAATVHKAQGSEFKAVVVIASMDHRSMLRRRLFNTAVSRGKQLVFVVGQRTALKYAVENAASLVRTTKLAEWIRIEQAA